MAELSADRKRREAERILADYENAADEYLNRGVLTIEDEIDRQRRRVASVIDEARQAGADVSDLTEEWMQIANRIIEAKKDLY